MKRRLQCITRWLLATCFLWMLPGGIWAATDKWDGNSTETSWYDNNTSASDYTLTTASELAGLAELVNDGTQNFAGKTIKLGADIDLDSKEWTPIGYSNGWAMNSDNNFQGIFNGQNHVINNLKISTAPGYGIGLFGEIENSTIQNLGVIISEDGITTGIANGGIAGKAQSGTIKNCFVTGGPINATGSSDDGYAGGILGHGSGTIEFCYTVISSISAKVREGNTGRAYAGGILGNSTSTTTIKNCLSFSGEVTSHLESNNSLAANNLIYGGGSSCTLTDTYSSPLTVKRKITFNGSNTISFPTDGSNNGTFLTVDNLNTVLNGWESAGWTITPGNLPSFGNNTPQLKIDNYIVPEGDGEAATPYELTCENHLQWVANGVNANISGFNGKHFKLTKDITLTSEWTPIGTANYPFTGVFDGNKKTISGLSIHTLGTYNGLFGNTKGTSSKIKDLTLDKVDISQNISTAPAGINLISVGALSGSCDESMIISNCQVIGGKIEVSYNSDTDIKFNIGGLIGDNKNSTTMDCCNKANITIKAANVAAGGICGYSLSSEIINCYNSGSIQSEGGIYAGGISGANREAIIESCYNTGTITARSITENEDKGGYICVGGIAGNFEGGYLGNCYSNTDLQTTILTSYLGSAGGICGVFIGCNSNEMIENCFSYGKVTSSAYAGGIVGIIGGNEDASGLAMKNCLALNETITGGNGQTGRITSPEIPEMLKELITRPVAITHCYTAKGMTLNGNPVEDANKAVDGFNGADWDYSISSQPITSWTQEAWHSSPSVKGATFAATLPVLNRIDPDTYIPGNMKNYLSETIKGQSSITASYTEPDPIPDPEPDPEPTPDPDPTPVFNTVTLPVVEGAVTDPIAGDYQVESWSSFRFYLTLQKEYDKSEQVVTTNQGETITPRSSDGAYIIKYVRTDVQISINGIVKNPAPVANEKIETNHPKIWKTDNQLHIQVATDGEGLIYTPDGKLQTVCKLTAGEVKTVQLPAGIYFIRIGKESFRIIL